MSRTVWLLAVLLILPGPVQGKSESTQAQELKLLKAQMAELQKYVKRLEQKIDGAKPLAAPVAGTDPLSSMESELGYKGPSTASPAEPAPAAPTPSPATPLPSQPAADPLATTEQEVATLKAIQPPQGNPRTAFNPQISVVGDFVYRNSSIDDDPNTPDVNGAPTGDLHRDRFSLREVEVAFQAAIDPFSRADIFLALPGLLEEFDGDVGAANEQKIEVEEAYISYWRLPYGMQLKGGKFRLEFGKNNRIHDHDMDYIDRPLVIQNFLGGEGIREQGLSLFKVFQLGTAATTLELTGQILNGEGGEETLFAGPGSDKTMGLERVRLYHDFNNSMNIDLGASHLHGKWDPNGNFQQNLRGYDLTFRYEPVEQNVYKQFKLQAEYIEGQRSIPVDFDLDGIPEGIARQSTDGMYVAIRYQFDRYWDVGGRYDRTNPAFDLAAMAIDPTLDPFFRARAIAAVDRVEGHTFWLTYLTSEFNRMRMEYTNRHANFPLGLGAKQNEEMITLQWIFAMGPHGAHKY